MKTVILDDWEHLTDDLKVVHHLRQFSRVTIYHDRPSLETLKDRVKPSYLQVR